MIRKSTWTFLQNLSRNNDREWFNAHKDQYLTAYANALEFFDSVLAGLNKHDLIETLSAKESLYRIYNDVRFSRDRPPYNPRFAGHFSRNKPWLRGGYYLWLQPGKSRLGCGFVYPNPADLNKIRLDILENHPSWRRLLRSKAIRSNFGAMRGDQVATAPRGFPKDHPALDLLRHKQFWFERPFSDREVLSPDFAERVNRTFRSIRPFFDYMTDLLTRDARGGAQS